MRVVGELLRGDRFLAHLAGLGENLEVAREARGYPERELLPGFFDAGLSELGTAADRVAHATLTLPGGQQPAHELVLLHDQLESLLAVDRDHGDPFEIA